MQRIPLHKYKHAVTCINIESHCFITKIFTMTTKATNESEQQLSILIDNKNYLQKSWTIEIHYKHKLVFQGSRITRINAGMFPRLLQPLNSVKTLSIFFITTYIFTIRFSHKKCSTDMYLVPETMRVTTVF